MSYQDIKDRAIERACLSWRTHQNANREPEPEDWPQEALLDVEKHIFRGIWRSTMRAFASAEDEFVAYAHSFDASLLTKPRFEESVVLSVLGEIKARLGPFGQSTRLFHDPSDFSWEERKPPTRECGR